MRVRQWCFAVALLAITSTALADDIPDLSKTPGVARAGLTKKRICEIKCGKVERHVTAAPDTQGRLAK